MGGEHSTSISLCYRENLASPADKVRLDHPHPKTICRKGHLNPHDSRDASFENYAEWDHDDPDAKTQMRDEFKHVKLTIDLHNPTETWGSGELSRALASAGVSGHTKPLAYAPLSPTTGARFELFLIALNDSFFVSAGVPYDNMLGRLNSTLSAANTLTRGELYLLLSHTALTDGLRFNEARTVI